MFDIEILDINGNPIERLYQYDTCVKIQIKNLDFKEKPIVHFCNKNSKNAMAILQKYTEYSNGTFVAEIPTPLLEEDLMIYVYLYTYDKESKCGRTIHVGNIPVCSKPKPDDYVDAAEWKGINAVYVEKRVCDLEDFQAETEKDIEDILDRINTEVSNRAEGDRVLNENLQTEIANRMNADKTLTANLSQEITDRKNADSTLQSNLNTEITNRTNADSALDSKITQEVTDRKAADTTLQNNINTVQANLTTEISNRTSADSNLQNQITTNKKAIDVLNGASEGSVSKQITDAFNDFATKMSDDGVVNTYKELVDYAAEHSEEAAAMAGSITENATAIESLEAYVGTIPDDYSSVVDYINRKDSSLISSLTTKIDEVSSSATTKANTAEQNAKKYADDTFVALNDIDPVLKQIYNAVYPVGSVYISKDAVSPETIFGGTWEQIKDKFLLAAGDNYFASSTGGTESYFLTMEQTPFTLTSKEASGYGLSEAQGFKNRVIIENPDQKSGTEINNMPPYKAYYMWERLTLAE